MLFALKLFLKKGEALSVNAFDIPIFLYILIIALSVAFSSLLMPAVKGFAKVIVYFSCYIVFFNILKDKPVRAYYLLAALAITAFSESVAAIYQNFIGVESLATWQDTSNINPEQIMTRVYGTLKPFNPNLLAGYLIAALSSTAGLFFIYASLKKVRLSLLFLIASVSIALAIVFTGSRGAYMALGAITTAFVLISGHIIWQDFKEKLWLKKLWLYLVIVGVFSFIALILCSPALQHRILSIFAFREDSSNSFRLNVYISSFKMFMDNWFIGIGPGNEVFRLIYGLYMKTSYDALAAYNIFLEIAVESGIIALFAFSWLILLVFIKSIAVIISKDVVLQTKILVSSCLIGVIGLMTHGFVDTIFFRPQLQVIFWLLIAVLAANITKERNKLGYTNH
ncbi:MAG TPA: O-antigen ligase family protein [Candidatus Gastranaerophilales bacterium]|nr:O-antigen ligase family protein [Candidatus Gastranaerophilales bacterium]